MTINSEEATLESAIAAAAGDESRDAELIATLAKMASTGQAEQAELLAWTWLTEAGKARPADRSAELGGKLLLIVPGSSQIRADLVALFRACGQADIDAWLSATGLAGDKVSPARSLRALKMALSLSPGRMVIERHEQRVWRIVRLDAPAGQATIAPAAGGTARALDILRLGDDYAAVADDDFRVLAQTDPQALAGLIESEPGKALLSAVRDHGGRLDSEQLHDMLVPRFLDEKKWSKWWSRARTAVRKLANLRIEGRMPAVLVYDEAGASPQDEALAAVDAAGAPAQRLAAVESFLKQHGKPDEKFLADLAQRAVKWLASPDATVADELVAAGLAELGAPLPPGDAERARNRLAGAADIRSLLEPVTDESLWLIALPIIAAARPPDGHADWRAAFLELLPAAPAAAADRIAADLLSAGQADRLNAEILAIVESPLESLDGLCWLWNGPAPAVPGLAVPPSGEILSQLLGLAHRADQLAVTDPKLARTVRQKVRAALSAKSYAAFRRHVAAMAGELAPMLRRQIRRCEGLGITVPEKLLAILDEAHPPVFEPPPKIVPWEQEDVIYVSAEALASKEKEQDRILNVEMPANAKAIGRAASYGDLSENSEYKFALEERDLLRARLARVNQELSMARVIHPQEVDASHVSIYSTVTLVPLAGGPAVIVRIVSPWDSDVAARRFNYKAPMSKLMLGRSVGDVVRVPIEGTEQDYRIESIQPPP